MTADLSEDVFNALALEVHAFQRRWNKPYAAFAATRPAPETWRDIPAVPQSAFKRAALTCIPRKDAPVTFRTSGTTGESRGEHHFFDTALYDAAILRGWRELQLPRLRQVILAPHPGEAPHSSLSHMFATLAAESDAPQAWCCDPKGGLDTTRALAELRRAHKSGPVALLGTALAFLHLFDVVAPGECNLQGSIALETGGYKGSGRDVPKAELHARFTTHLGIPAEDIINEYGMTELSSQFYARGAGAAHRGAPWIRALVIDPETGVEVVIGQAGVLRLFDLANLNSCLAIETQDLAIRRENGFELLGRDPQALPRGCSRAADEVMSR
jgi:hypothetical protein